MALVMQHGHPVTVRANLSMYFAFSVLVSIISYAVAGILTREILLVSLSFLPCPLLGFALGVRSRAYVDKGKFRFVLLAICSLAAVITLTGAVIKL